MSNSTFATRFYSYNNSYAIKLQTVKLQVAAAWLRSKGCIFSTYSDKDTGLTKIYLKSIPTNVVEALVKKHGFFNAKATAPKTAPIPASSRPAAGTISREEWLSRFRSPAADQAVAQPKARKIRNADELPRDAVALKPIAVVVPQLCVEDRLYNKEMQNGLPVVTGTYTCRTVQLESEGYIKAIAFTDKEAHIAANHRQTNSNLAGGVAHQSTTVANTEIGIMPGCATTEQLMSCTLNQLYKFASTHNIKGRSSLKGEKNKAALVEKLLGLVKKSSI